jgi:hypothetical protein
MQRTAVYKVSFAQSGNVVRQVIRLVPRRLNGLIAGPRRGMLGCASVSSITMKMIAEPRECYSMAFEGYLLKVAHHEITRK